MEIIKECLNKIYVIAYKNMLDGDELHRIAKTASKAEYQIAVLLDSLNNRVE